MNIVVISPVDTMEYEQKSKFYLEMESNCVMSKRYLVE